MLSSINPQPISIHALLAESDFRHCTTYLNCSRFLSTLSLRRATSRLIGVNTGRKNFYPRSPCGERPVILAYLILSMLFLSTLSLRRATPQGCSGYLDNIISIHALLAESDKSLLTSVVSSTDFYPRSPCGERPHGQKTMGHRSVFLSTLSLRRATFLHCTTYLNCSLFLSTLSLRRATQTKDFIWETEYEFLSTLSLRRATISLL